MFDILNPQPPFVKPNKWQSGVNVVVESGIPGPPSDIVSVVSLSLRRERARAALSLTELARRAGIAKSTLSQLENGSGNPSLETLWALGTALAQ